MSLIISKLDRFHELVLIHLYIPFFITVNLGCV